MKHTLIALTFLTLVLGGAGCGGQKEPEALRVSMFVEVDILRIVEKRLDLFEKQTGLKVKAEVIPYNNYREKLVTQLAAGRAPDVIWVETGLVTHLEHSGALVPLNDYMKESGMTLEDRYPSVVSRFTFDGQVVALPMDTAPIACVYYNKKMFRDAGLKPPPPDWTWDDLLRYAKKLTKRKGDRIEVYGYQDNYGPEWRAFIYGNGATLVDDWRKPKRCTMDDPAAIEGVQFLADLATVHRVSPLQSEANTLLSLGQDLFITGKLAMVHTGIWITPALRKAPDLEWDIVPFPRGPRAKQPGWSTGGSGWAISKDARNRDDAWRLASFLASEPSQRAFAATGFIQPSIRKLAESDLFLHSAPPQNKGFLLEAPRYAVYAPTHPRWEEMEDSIIEPNLSAVLRGEEKAEVALKRITARINETLFGIKP